MTAAQANYILFQTVGLGLEQMITTLTIISLVPARVLANQRYEQSERDDRVCTSPIGVSTH